MKVSNVKTVSRQLTLFNRDEFLSIRNADGSMNHGRCRTKIGQHFEELTAEIFHGSMHKTDCSCDYCPDVSVDGFGYLEVKAVGRSKQMFVYKGRLSKDLEFSRDNKLWYIVWTHACDTTKASNVSQLLSMVRDTTKGYFFVPFDVLYLKATSKKVQPLNSRYGHSDSNPTYGEGYRIPTSEFEEFFIAA